MLMWVYQKARFGCKDNVKNAIVHEQLVSPTTENMEPIGTMLAGHQNPVGRLLAI